jgi:hypothetical protein
MTIPDLAAIAARAKRHRVWHTRDTCLGSAPCQHADVTALLAHVDTLDEQLGLLTVALVDAEGTAADLRMLHLAERARAEGAETDVAGLRARVDQLEAALADLRMSAGVLEAELAGYRYLVTEAGLDATRGGAR